MVVLIGTISFKHPVWEKQQTFETLRTQGQFYGLMLHHHGFAISYYRFYNKNIIFLLIGLFIAIIFHFLFNYGFFELIVLMQLAILFFLFKNLKKRQAIIKKVWHD